MQVQDFSVQEFACFCTHDMTWFQFYSSSFFRTYFGIFKFHTRWTSWTFVPSLMFLVFFLKNKDFIACLGGNLVWLVAPSNEFHSHRCRPGHLPSCHLAPPRRHPLQSNHNFNKQFVAVRNAQSDQSFSRGWGGVRWTAQPVNTFSLLFWEVRRCGTKWQTSGNRVRHASRHSQRVSLEKGSGVVKGTEGTRRQKRGRRVDHKFGDVSGCGEDERPLEYPRPPPTPPPGRGASLRFAISGDLNPKVERSAGPISKSAESSRRAFRSRKHRSRRDVQRSREKSISNKIDCLLLIYCRRKGK